VITDNTPTVGYLFGVNRGEDIIPLCSDRPVSMSYVLERMFRPLVEKSRKQDCSSSSGGVLLHTLPIQGDGWMLVFDIDGYRQQHYNHTIAQYFCVPFYGPVLALRVNPQLVQANVTPQHLYSAPLDTLPSLPRYLSNECSQIIWPLLNAYHEANRRSLEVSRCIVVT
jgi:hypothetical protein